MASKFELLAKVYDDVSKDVIRSPDKWQKFLSSVCFNHRLRFDEQLLVYAQRPDATAVLEFEKWNKRFNRRINKGSKGIAVFTDDNRKYIKYYFDISNTAEREHSKPVPVWQYKEEYRTDVIETLALAIHHFYFGVPKDTPKLNNYGDDDYWESVEDIAKQLANPDRVSEIQSVMTELYNTIDFEDRYKEYAEKGIKTINEFADGTFTCFGDKSRTIAPLLKVEKSAEKETEKQIEDKTSPEWLKEYNRLKSKYPNTIAFYQVGDFYETFDGDAKVVAKHLDLVITSRHINETERVAMCGFPVRSLDKNMERLNTFGFSVVVSDLKNDVRKEKLYPYPPLANDYKIEKAKELINDFVNKEYEHDDGADFSDLTNINVAYTNLGDNEEHEVQASVDLVNFAVNKYYDGKLAEHSEYKNLDELIEFELEGLSYDDLVYIDEDKITEPEKSSVTTEQALQYIKNFTEISTEGTDENQFDDLSDIPLAYSTTEDSEHEIQVSANLVDFSINQFIDDKLVYTEQYNSLEDMTEQALKWLDFDDLVSVSDEAELKFKELSENEILPAPKSQPKSRVQSFDLHPEIPMSERHNYNFAEKEIETVGKKERFRRNIDAINVLRDCEFENRFATPEEQEILSGYVGWGGIPEAFDENNEAWADEFIELYTVLSPDEYNAARASTLTAFYTPQPVISAIYKALDNLGFKQGNILDKTTPRLIQFHTLKNAVNPPFLGGFSIFNTVVA